MSATVERGGTLAPAAGTQAALERLRSALAARPARLAVCLLAQEASPSELAAVLRRLPSDMARVCQEVVVFAAEDQVEVLRETLGASPLGDLAQIGIKGDPRRYGWGGRRKIACEYVLERGFELFALCEADVDLPLEELPALFAAALEAGAQVVIASRGPAPRRVSSWLHDRLLGLELADWSSPLRVYARELLLRLPFQLAADDRCFDTELLIQCRALGARVLEVAVPRFAPGSGERAFSAGRSLAAAIDYRLHQLHLTRRGQFLVDPGVRYSFKRSPHGSHVQILEAIREGTRVLDLGCSQGLLAAPLASRGVRVTGVDAEAPRRVAPELDHYYQHDLEQPLELAEGRVFDYVVVSDVIEHVRNRTQLLRGVRRHLKPDGRLLISTPNIANWFYRLSLLAGRFEYGPRGILDETHVHLFTRATFRREVARAGFRILAERVTALPFELIFESTGQSRLVRGLSAAYHALARLWPEMFAYQFILEAEGITLHDRSAGEDEAAILEPPRG